MDEIVYRVLKRTFLFSELSDDDFKKTICSLAPELEVYSKGDLVCSPRHFERRIGFVISGECAVKYVHDNSSDIRIRTLGPNDSFGIISVFSSGTEYPTTITATKNCRIVYLTEKDIYKLIELLPQVAIKIIRFFADKINFLSSKVATFSSQSVEQKMAHYILSESKAQGSLKISLNKARAATEIGVGRASLYRILSRLSDEKMIEIDNKTVQIIDLEGLERITK